MAGSDTRDDNAESIRDNLRAERQRRVNVTIEDIDHFKETSPVYKSRGERSDG